MKSKYETEPIYLLYEALSKMKGDISEDMDELTYRILMNNGCSASGNIKQMICEIVKDEYNVVLIKGMLGNKSNEFYDYIEFGGIKSLIIFADYFEFVTQQEIDNYTYEDRQKPEVALKINMGNSTYYSAIEKIVDIFYLTFSPISNGLLTTAVGTNQRYNRSIIAATIINEYKPIDENDIDDTPLKYMQDVVANKHLLYLKLIGYRSME